MRRKSNCAPKRFFKNSLKPDNEKVNSFSEEVRGDLYKFSTKAVVERGAYLDSEGCFVLRTRE